MEKEYDDFNEQHITKRWQQYLETVKKVHPLLITAFELIASNTIKTAIDIGCGPGNETNFLVSQNINTLAIDYNKQCLQKINSNFPLLKEEALFSFQATRIENFKWQNADLMLCLKVLPFLSKAVYLETLQNIKKHLKPKGIVVASVFGKEDDWQDLHLISAAEIKYIFKDYKALYFKESKGKLKAVSGNTKKAHLIDFVFQKQF